MDTQQRITWDKTTREKFDKILEQIPDLVRGIAQIRITKKAEGLIREQNRSEITAKEMIDAFFAETPPAFFNAMKEGMKEVGIDYVKYGHK